MSKWKPIHTAPRDGTWIWTYWPQLHNTENRQRAARWYKSFHNGEYWEDAADAIDWCQPTHWMPLPPAPEAKS